MPRAKHLVASHRRRKRVLAQAKGYWGARSKVYTIAKHHVEKGMQYAYRDRRARKRDFRRLWITRINAGARMHGTSYSRLMAALDRKKVGISRKVLADLALKSPEAFAEVVRFAFA